MYISHFYPMLLSHLTSCLCFAFEKYLVSGYAAKPLPTQWLWQRLSAGMATPMVWAVQAKPVEHRLHPGFQPHRTSSRGCNTCIFDCFSKHLSSVLLLCDICQVLLAYLLPTYFILTFKMCDVGIASPWLSLPILITDHRAEVPKWQKDWSDNFNHSWKYTNLFFQMFQ